MGSAEKVLFRKRELRNERMIDEIPIIGHRKHMDGVYPPSLFLFYPSSLFLPFYLPLLFFTICFPTHARPRIYE